MECKRCGNKDKSLFAYDRFIKIIIVVNVLRSAESMLMKN